MFRKVLDIDFISSKYSKLAPKDKEFVMRMLFKIRRCKHFITNTFSLSSFKGCHIELFCNIDCDICRMCYDDEKHFAYDMNRLEYARNILFDKKERIKIK